MYEMAYHTVGRFHKFSSGLLLLHPHTNPENELVSRQSKAKWPSPISPPGSWGPRTPRARKTLFIDILETSEWAAYAAPNSLGVKLATAILPYFFATKPAHFPGKYEDAIKA
jgi:hypothetical protein